MGRKTLTGGQEQHKHATEPPKVSFLEVTGLLATEAFKEACVRNLVKAIIGEGIWRTPICVERTHGLVMDGHHRLEAARRMLLRRIPCLVFDYGDVIVCSRRPDLRVTPQSIIERGLSGRAYPYKTTKHIFPCDLPDLAIPIDNLRHPSGKEDIS